jgi:hypothetical protein
MTNPLKTNAQNQYGAHPLGIQKGHCPPDNALFHEVIEPLRGFFSPLKPSVL